MALAASLGLFATACALPDNYYRPAKGETEMRAGFGRVIVSTGAASKCIPMVTAVAITPIEDRMLSMNTIYLFVDNWVSKSDFSDHHGNVYSLMLRAGKYKLYPHVMNPNVRPRSVPVGDFYVDAGETTYIGEYYMPVACKLTTVSQFRDEEARDLAVLSKTDPEIAKITISKHIAMFVDRID